MVLKPPIEQMIVIPDKTNPKKGGISHVTSGLQSKYLAQFGACSRCPIRDYCDLRELMSAEHQKRGCQEVRELFKQSVSRWKKPALVMIRNAAQVETMLGMQELKDGKDAVLGSKNWFKLKELELKIARLIMKYDPKAQQKVTVQHQFGPDSDEVINLDPDAYESEVLIENTDVHANVTDRTLDSNKDQIKGED